MVQLIYIYILFFIVLFFIFYKINNHFQIKKIEFFDNKIIFLNKNELLFFLLNNDDKYYDTFFENDFYARKINNIGEYKKFMKLSVTDFNNIQKNKIKKCIYNADLFFSNLKFNWFDGKKNNKLKWIIGCIKGKLYESGLPHTRDNYIIISDEKINNYNEEKLTKTLIHEKIHIYQKNYINDIEIYLNENNFKKIKKREKYDNIRANPDLDNWIYKDNKQNIYKAIYNNNPLSIEDIKYIPINNQSYEHPYEKMAIYIENIFINS
jgi:hypothetical protein